ncbi:putative leucine-rich repeat receptor-like serine/threonine-protein kinase At2g14440 [Cryptomeria japonica]|uniref:putative leucine-rich repeat receptor-like serine/threonine-protein kinase At2g14440 n=1 Tax=Cryptomeria japonica TaxID=3369 RepID=UPI0027DAA292|nr:putative leucine-rich repeat receptor-like serine/threonine-protein kinase At2g14440 [Cryptomeria japonica]
MTQESYYVFISTIELRPLQSTMYNTSNDFNYNALKRSYGINFGGPDWINFPQDQYDRMWKPFPVPLTTSISTNESSFRSVKNQPPVSVLKTAITSRVGEELLISEWFNAVPGIYYFALYLCNINKTSVSGNNTFQVFIGNVQIAETEVPEYMYCSSPETRLELSTTDSTDIRIRSKAGSEMRPFINAAEAYQIVNITNMTRRRWNLTSMGLTGNIPPSIANLTALQQLNNKLDGDVPPGLIKPGLNLEVHPQNKPPQGRKDKGWVIGPAIGYKDDPNEFEKVVVEYSEEDIKAATNNYSTLIGKGGFESVFYGQLSGNNVAVKILSTDSSQGKQEFRIEASYSSPSIRIYGMWNIGGPFTRYYLFHVV